MTKSPIFIVGCGRSGTTMLRLIINRHPNIAIPEETWFFPDLYKVLNTILEKENWQEIVSNYIKEKTKIHFPELSKEEILEALISVESSDVPAILSTVNRIFTKKGIKHRWGDKTPGYVLHLGLLKELYPKSKVIHIIRDGRDVVPSLLKYWTVGPQTDSFIETAYYWKKHVSAGIKDGEELFGENYLDLKYEELVIDPEKQLRIVCEFIEEDFELAMLEEKNHDEKSIPVWEWHKKTKETIDGSHTQLWVNNLSTYQKGIMYMVAGRLLKQLGYYGSHSINLKSLKDVLFYNVKAKFNYLLYKVKVFIYRKIN